MYSYLLGKSLFPFNIQSVRKKLDEFYLFSDNVSLKELMCLTEHWLKLRLD